MNVFRNIPKSFSKKAREAALAALIRPTTRPDGDNYLKGVLDALNGILWTDDARIVDMSCHKYYSEHPRLEVTSCSHSKAG